MSDLFRKIERVQAFSAEAARREFYTPCEVAARLGLSEEQVQRHLRLGRIPGIKLGRKWMIPVVELDKVLSAVNSHESQVVEE